MLDGCVFTVFVCVTGVMLSQLKQCAMKSFINQNAEHPFLHFFVAFNF